MVGGETNSTSAGTTAWLVRDLIYYCYTSCSVFQMWFVIGKYNSWQKQFLFSYNYSLVLRWCDAGFTLNRDLRTTNWTNPTTTTMVTLMKLQIVIISDVKTMSHYNTVCSPIKAKFRSWALTCANIRFLTLRYSYGFVWRFQKCMNGCCSSIDKKVIRFLIFRKIGFLNFCDFKKFS